MLRTADALQPPRLTRCLRGTCVGMLLAELGAGAVVPTIEPELAGAQEPPLELQRLSGAIELDGRSDEPAWQAIAPLPVVMHEPNFGAAPSERTVLRVAYDDEYLYAAGELYDAEPDGIRSVSLKRDDTSYGNDWFILLLDTFNDKENALIFGTTPAGIRTDGVVPNDATRAGGNWDWNTFWDAAVEQTDEGWFAEIRIPLSSLRFQEKDGRVVMGMSVWRRIARKNEAITFPAIPNQWGFLSVFKASQAREVVLHDVRRRNPLYATPYLLAGSGRSHTLNEVETGYVRSTRTIREAGLDLKYALTSNLTLDLTYNTDFAQVEADEQQVNLTRFSLFFPEKRLFFQERAAVFDFALGENDRLFYSRRIGLASGLPLPIHGGARLVGRTGGWDLGVLNMQAAAFDGLPVENFGVARLRRQVLNENSYVGGILTTRMTEREVHLTYGVDGILRLLAQDYLTLSWAQSYAWDPGATGAPLDHSHVRARWERRGLDRLTYALDISRVGGAFDPAMGFLQRNGYTRLGDHIAYGWRPGPASVLLRHTLALRGYVYRSNEDGWIESARVGPEWVVESKSGHMVTVSAASVDERLASDFPLTDSVVVPSGRYRSGMASLVYQAPRGAVLRPNVSLEAGSFFDGWQATARFTPTWNLSRILELGGTYQASEVRFPERNEGFRAYLVSVRGRLTLSTRFAAAALVQYNNGVDGVFGNIRIRYNPREGDDLYLVYNAGFNTDRFGSSLIRPALDNYVLMVKYARTFDLGR